MITGTTTGYIEAQIEEMKVNDEKKEHVKKGDVVTFPLSEKIRASDKLYKVIYSE